MLNINRDVFGQSEDALQQKCFFWHWNEYPEQRKLLFAVPNGGARDSKHGKLLKLTGVTKGVSDMIYLHDGIAYLFELKKDDDAKLSKDQLEWADLVTKNGFRYFKIWTLEGFKSLVNHLNNKSENVGTWVEKTQDL